MKKGQVYEGVIESVDFPNNGKIRLAEEEKTVIVKNGISGQNVRFSLNKIRKEKAEGRILEVLEKAPAEIQPSCPHFGECGGCTYQNLPYEEQLRLKEQQVKAIVIACNTASALALDAVKDEFDLPIIGVVIPGARAAVEATTNGKVGVVGTEATVQSGMYTKVIQGMNPKIEVIEKACPLFVPLVEEGFKEHIVTREIIEYYLESMRNTDIDAMILGCTHYPLLRSKIREYMGDKIQIVNPAYETAMDLKRLLEEEEMANDETTEHHSEYSFYVSDAAEKFRKFANTVMPFDVPTTNVVNIEEY